MSFGDSLNIVLNDIIRKKPPIMEISFYLNGKPSKRTMAVGLVFNGKTIVKSLGNKLSIDTSKFQKNDSIFFTFTYNKHRISSKKVAYKTYIHGGQLIFGLVSNYDKSRRDFDSTDSGYLHANDENGLYDILFRTTRIDSSYLNKGYSLNYCIVKNNIDYYASFGYNFVAP